MRHHALRAAAQARAAARMRHARTVYGDATPPRQDAFYDATVEQVRVGVVKSKTTKRGLNET